MQEARKRLGAELYADQPSTLASVRLSRAYSQTHLANALGTSQSHIAKIESGAVDIQWETATRLADALGLKLDELRILIARSKKQ